MVMLHDCGGEQRKRIEGTEGGKIIRIMCTVSTNASESRGKLGGGAGVGGSEKVPWEN